ncbi:MAG TPA: hypothetical protein PL066_00765 [bacterium]|nr:hypothetical protein [bacterium]
MNSHLFAFLNSELQQNPYKSSLLTLIADKYPDKEKELGKLVIFLSSDNNFDYNEEKFQELLKELENIYYNYSLGENEVIGLKKLEQIFEQSLKNFNQQFTWLAQAKQINLDLKQINILVAVIRNNDFIFSQVNSLDLFVLFKGKQGEEKIINIAEQGDARTPTPSVQKLFANLISGDLSSAQRILITNKNLAKYLSLYKIKNLLLGKNAEQVDEAFKQNLRQITNADNFAWILLKRWDAEEMATEEEELEKEHGLNPLPLHKTEEKSAVKPSLGQTINHQLLNIKKSLGPKNKGNVSKTVFNETIEIDFGSRMKKFLTILPFYPSNQQTQQYALSKGSRLKNFFKNLFNYPLLLKFGFLLVLLTIGGFIYSAVYIRQQQQEALALEQYQTDIRTVQSEIASARAKLLYGDKLAAEQIYLGLDEKIDALLAKTDEQINNKNQLSQESQALYYEIFNITLLDQPTALADLNSLTDGKIKYNELELLGNDLIALGGKAKILLSVSSSSGQVRMIDTQSDAIPDFKLAMTLPENQDNLYFWQADKAIWEFTAANQALTDLQVLLPENFKPNAVASYNKNLYFTDPNNKQIWKFTKVTSGFAKGKAWIMDVNLPSLERIKDMAIDSNIFLLYDNGQIDKYFNGKKEKSFNLDNIQPALSGADKIYTNEEFPVLYIASFIDKRIIVTNKDGAFQKQYQIKLDGEIQDLFFKNNQVFILSDNQVFVAGL